MKLLGSRRKGYLFVGAGAVLLFLGFLPLNTFLPACLYWEIRTNVSNGEGQYIRTGYLVGASFVTFDVLVSGGNNSITLFLMDGATGTLKSAVVNVSQSLSLNVPKNDFYILYLKNSHSLSSTNNKQILVKIYYYFYNYVFGFVGSILLVPCIILVLHSYLAERSAAKINKNRMN